MTHIRSTATPRRSENSRDAAVAPLNEGGQATHGFRILTSNQWIWNITFTASLVASVYGLTVEPGWEWFLVIPFFAWCGWCAGLPGVVVVTKRGIWRWTGFIGWERVIGVGSVNPSPLYGARNWVPVLAVVSKRNPDGVWITLKELRRSERTKDEHRGIVSALSMGGSVPLVEIPTQLSPSLW